MPFEIVWSQKALKELGKIERPIAKRIHRAIGQLGDDPFQYDVRKLTNSSHYRLRVGDYRVLLEIRQNQLRILVIQIGHRKNVYY